MYKIFALLVVLLIPAYLIAQEQVEKSEMQSEEQSKDFNFKTIKKIEKPAKPSSAPSVLSDDEKKMIVKIKEMKDNIPLTIQNELKNFREQKDKLNHEKKKLFDALSKEAKTAITNEAKLRKKLSIKARKAARESLD